MEFENFLKWVTDRSSKLTVDTESVKNVAKRAFESHVKRSDPLPSGGIPIGKNYLETRQQQWGERFEVLMVESWLTVRPKV